MKRPKILVVEDDGPIADAVLYALRKDGMIADVAETLAAARVAFGQCDLLVLDLGLPDGTGCDLLAKVRKSQDLPAIALSGYGTRADVQLSREAGFRAHLTKPIDIDQLDLEVQSLVGAMKNLSSSEERTPLKAAT